MAELIDPTSGGPADEPKIVVDSDWKAEAQKEKERLAEQEAAAESSGAAAGGRMPEADFRGLIGSLATQALMYLGAFPDPDGRAIVAPEYARHSIDLLGVLEEKTKGNLTDEESKELEGVMHELRMRFVQIVQGVAAASVEGPALPPDEGPPAPASQPDVAAGSDG